MLSLGIKNLYFPVDTIYDNSLKVFGTGIFSGRVKNDRKLVLYKKGMTATMVNHKPNSTLLQAMSLTFSIPCVTMLPNHRQETARECGISEHYSLKKKQSQ
ncbi:hypothetical protein TNIN_210591 [Trichonephila inaurata madagascariensis]|uniref:Uncharacterized protein n=1 Tax=Trichonephila inaurata madagascariensis TaxID=2747483 RepID=A0A8X7CCB7_9ARAC|nr:hypothetical protein TNIN_210591 [Trichonephila inaurata madagascariensis]